MEMSQIDTPIVCVVIGEGGSGGALGIGIGDRLAMLEHAYYSVISPEGCASILWKGASTPPRPPPPSSSPAATCSGSGSSTRSSPSRSGGAHRDHREAASNLKAFLLRQLRELDDAPLDRLLDLRYEKYRKIGVFTETPPAIPDLEPRLNGKAEIPA